jgi:regulator of nucleoside diphosphate kinase
MSAHIAAAPIHDRPAPAPLWRIYPSGRPTAAQQWAVRGSADDGGLPPIHVTHADHRRIERLIAARLGRSDAIAAFLARELDRAILCRPEDLPPDVVTLDARVVFRTDDGAEVESRTLVAPDQEPPAGRHVSVLSPLGAALLGLREGDRMPFADRGALRSVRVEMVAFQPQAHRRRPA